MKGEALRLLRTNSSTATFEENISNFNTRLLARGYPCNLIERTLSEIKFTERDLALKQDNKNKQEILPFVTQYEPSVPNIKKILIKNWHIIQNQPRLREIFKEPPITSFRKGKSLKVMLVRAKLLKVFKCFTPVENCAACQPLLLPTVGKNRPKNHPKNSPIVEWSKSPIVQSTFYLMP